MKLKLIKKSLLPLFIILLIYSTSFGQNRWLDRQQAEKIDHTLHFVQITTDSLYNSKQIISLLMLQKETLDSLHLAFSHNNADLKTTSSLAKSVNALAAINGGFFNMDSGGSVSYFEIKDSVISRTRNPDLKWGITDSLLNGAIIILDDNDIELQRANSDQFYELSKRESAVLICGPLLLLNSQKMNLPNMKFVSKRHPRSCLCLTEEEIVMITIDGRSDEAVGMSLLEVQNLLLNMGCTDAINLDGGGSTTMWIKNKGVVNFPSDKVGERPVSNILLILNRNNH